MTAQLAATLAGLFRASRSDGRQRSRVLSKGLEVRVGTADGDVIYLSRKDGQASQDEAAIVAQAAGWVLFDTELESWNGTRYLLIRPSGSLEEDIEDEVEADVTARLLRLLGTVVVAAATPPVPLLFAYWL